MSTPKKAKIPMQHEFYAAAYRFGWNEATIRKEPRGRDYFSTDGALKAYCDAFETRRQAEKGTN